jgi:hypothetical protein
VYAGLGWRLLKAQNVIRIDENGFPQSLPEKNVTMFYPLCRSDIPSGDILLQGNDW